MKKSLKKPLILIYIILLCSIFISISISKYQSNISGTINMECAKIKLNIGISTATVANISNEWQEIELYVWNYDGLVEEPIYNEVEYNYQIAISTKNNIPITYELYKIENSTQTQVTLIGGVTGNYTMPHSQIKKDIYILKVKLEDKTYKNIVDVININVSAIQSEPI